MQMRKKYIDSITYEIIGAAFEVHRELGPGLLETIYEKCFVKEMILRGFNVKNQIAVPIQFKGYNIDAELRLDVLVEDLIVVELKAVEKMNTLYEAQILSYMKLLQVPKGILINFCCTNIFKEGQKTFVNEIYANLPD